MKGPQSFEHISKTHMLHIYLLKIQSSSASIKISTFCFARTLENKVFKSIIVYRNKKSKRPIDADNDVRVLYMP